MRFNENIPRIIVLNGYSTFFPREIFKNINFIVFVRPMHPLSLGNV